MRAFGEDIVQITRKLARASFVLAALCLAGASHAQDAYPSRPIRVLVPVGPGAGLDNAARITADAVEKHLGQRLVFENKPGAASCGRMRRWPNASPMSARS
jgi:tripartite-type tricarboxylate transporter receptor subunit TctC